MSFSVIIPSARMENLRDCVWSIVNREEMDPADVIVVDDGAGAAGRHQLPPVTWLEGIKPFVFSRNVNLGIKASLGNDVIVMNDDSRLESRGGFSALSKVVRESPEVGLASAAIEGFVGNPAQAPQGRGMRFEPRVVAFVCVYIPRSTVERVGLLDERYVSYGGDDMDYCKRTRDAGLKLGIFDGCIVSHGKVASTYRSRPDIVALFEDGKRIFREKYPGEKL